MSLKEFLKEQKAERKQMREEMKKSKKQPKTKREKVYKIVGIIFAIAVAVGAIAYAFRGVGSGYDWSKISGLTDEMKTKLSEPVDENALINEIGQESIVRNGVWQVIPGGAHIEQLKKGDIVFNADQTRELIKYGKVMSGGGHGVCCPSDGDKDGDGREITA